MKELKDITHRDGPPTEEELIEIKNVFEEIGLPTNAYRVFAP